MTASPLDAVSALRSRVRDLAALLAVWRARNEPDAPARRAASEAIEAIDAMLRELHTVRQQLVSEIRKADDATAARADSLLTRKPARPYHPPAVPKIGPEMLLTIMLRAQQDQI